MDYTNAMYEIQKTTVFAGWFRKLRDLSARQFIAARLRRLELGNLGDVRPVGDGVSELRIHFGPGYRVYLKKSGTTIIVLLCAGDKATQAVDIRTALRLAQHF
jgi:putative addiction module killer protein